MTLIGLVLGAGRRAFERNAGARHDEGWTVVRDLWADEGCVVAVAGRKNAGKRWAIPFFSRFAEKLT